MSAIGAVFALLFVGQPFGSDAAALPVPFVAASPAAATTARTSTATAPITRGLQSEACRDIGLPGNRSIASSHIHWLWPLATGKGLPSSTVRGRRRNWDPIPSATIGDEVKSVNTGCCTTHTCRLL